MTTTTKSVDNVIHVAESTYRDAEEFLDQLRSRGAHLEGYRREYGELHNTLEALSDGLIEKEREIEAYKADVFQLRDQASMARKNIDETILSKDTLQANVDNLRENKTRLMEREMLNRSQISLFSSKFEKLHEALEEGPGWTVSQDEERQELEKERDFLSKKLDNRTNVVLGIRVEVDQLYELIQTLENQNAEIDEEIRQRNEEVDELSKKSQVQSTKSDALSAKVKSLQNAIAQADEDYASRKSQMKHDDKTFSGLEKVLKSLKDRMDGYIREYESLFDVAHNLTIELERQRSLNKQYEDEIEEKLTYIEEKQKELATATKENIKIIHLRDAAKTKIEEIDSEKTKLDVKRDEIQKKLSEARDVEEKHIRKRNESLTKQRASLKGELEVLRKKHVGTEKSAKSIIDLIHLNQNAKRNLNIEKKVLQDEVAVQFTQIQQLLQEKEKHEHDAEITTQEYYTALEELKLQELQIRELQKKIAEDQAKLKHKQNLYEAVRADRNLYSKQLVESQDEINALKRKFRLTNHQIEQIKEEISSKDHAIVKEHFHHHSVDKERELLKNELTKIRKQVVSSEQIIENQHVEVLKLTRIIEEADLERQRQTNELVAIVAERNLLTAQVVKRNGELSEMYDKIKIQRSNLRIGEKQYSDCMENLKQLKSQLISIVKQNNSTITELSNLETVKRTVLRLEKELLQEQSKARALAEELDRPMNVHRWRILESSDPQRYEKIKQIQLLQKELIDKSDLVVEKELMIQEKEKVYVELKNIIARQPGPDVDEQLLTYQLAYKDKVKQLSAMNNELDMYRMQVKTFKDEIISLDEKMNSLKNVWKKTKRLTQ